MLLFPKKPKFLKSFANKQVTAHSKKINTIYRFSRVGLMSCEAGFIPNFQIEAARLFLRKLLKKRAQLFFRIYPAQPITKKPSEVRLGRGKGNLKYWAFYIKKGNVLLELNGHNTKQLTLALTAVKYKLSIKTYVYNQQSR
jgi:large subunit ribosomal protein L16